MATELPCGARRLARAPLRQKWRPRVPRTDRRRTSLRLSHQARRRPAKGKVEVALAVETFSSSCYPPASTCPACDSLTFSVAANLLKFCANRTAGVGVINGVSDSEFLCALPSNLSIRLTAAWP